MTQELNFDDSKMLNMIVAGMSREAVDTAQVIPKIASIATYKYNLDNTWKKISAERSNDWEVKTEIVERENTMPYWIAREDDGLIAYLAEKPWRVLEAEWKERS